MTTENILGTSAALNDIQSRFTSAQWDRALTLINSSEMLKAKIRLFERNNGAGHAMAFQVKTPPGESYFEYDRGLPKLALGSSWFDSPEKFVGVLAHEMRRYVNRRGDLSGWNKSVACRNPKSVQTACLRREGYAFHAI